ncbi:hypothetical protein E2C01_099885 [Portunus trituberculatus]|uniref:Uncharacterized protein n=1 Tax=Portunus trituberculatus TaxID=210409 RepID=A0A5B7K4Y9_PORTR|nr:hypothetical protein [Portunus trituberculatus]
MGVCRRGGTCRGASGGGGHVCYDESGPEGRGQRAGSAQNEKKLPILGAGVPFKQTLKGRQEAEGNCDCQTTQVWWDFNTCSHT